MKSFRYISLTAIIVACSTLYVRGEYSSAEVQATAPLTNVVLGVGALGRIEPKSRVIHISSDAGTAGAIVEELLVQEGQTVKAGTRIATFSDHARRQAEVDLAAAEISSAAARLRAAEAECRSARRDYDRKNALLKGGVVSAFAFEVVETRLNKAEADVEAAKASIKQAQANLQLKRAQLLQATATAPIDGVVIKIHVRPGERIGDEGVVDVADLAALDVVAEVYESDIPRVKISQKAVVRLSGSDATYSAEVRELGFMVRKNHVNDTDPLADRDNRIVEVRLTLLGAAVASLRHQLYRQVQVHIEP